MAKRKFAPSPVNGGVRRKRVTAPKMAGSVIDYSALQRPFFLVNPAGYTGDVRFYVPGFPSVVGNSVGPEVVGSYSSGKYLPGTRARWEPSVSFTTTGRVFCGFTDNPEVAVQINNLFGACLGAGGNTPTNWAAYGAAVKGLGSVESWPVWQETEIEIPTRLRRKMFDINVTLSNPPGPDELDRCMQVAMFFYIEGMPEDIQPGGFWFHDKVAVEGLHSRLT